MTALRLLLLLALLGVAPAAAQGFEVEFDRVPSVGQPLGIAVTIEGAEPADGRLYFRPTGAPTYDSVVPTRTGDTFRAEVPAEVMTIRGIEVYGEYVRGGETHTYPPENPAARPIPISLFIGSAVSEVVLPPRAYRMIAVPADLGETPAVRVLSDDFGALDPNNWRLVRWDPAAARYVDAPDGPNDFARGTAFWLITSRGGSFDIDGAETTPAGPQPVTLEPGCNQIGNPFAFPVAWSDVSGSEVEGVEPPAAFDGEGDYLLDRTVLEPWVGYFVCNGSGETVTLMVPPREAVDVRPAAEVPSSFEVRLSARSEAGRGASAVIGFAEGARDGRDALDRTALPAIGEGVSVRVAEAGEALARSLKPEGAEGAAWDVEVVASAVAGAAQWVPLALETSGEPPEGFRLYVIDRALGTALPVVGGAVEVTLRPDEPVRALRLIVGTEAYARGASEGAPLEVTPFGLDAGYPNPFSEATSLRYRLAERGPATLEVFDLLGRRVRVLADGVQRAGAHEVRWDGLDADGRRVASGVYLVRLRTDAATATRRVSLLR